MRKENLEMSSDVMRQETYLPGDDGPLIRDIVNFLEAIRTAGDGSTMTHLVIDDSSGRRIAVPKEIFDALTQVAEAMANGLAVTVCPQTQTLTTQQAAELLGVSRPTVIRLLDTGALPFERIGTHRKLLLRDVIAFRERRRMQQYEALAALEPLGEDEDLDVIITRLRDARRKAAEQRQSV